MISIAYINGSSQMEIDNMFAPFESFFESCLDDFNKSYTNFSTIKDQYILESAIMSSVSENLSMVYESEKKGILATIGEKIVAIYNKFAQLIDNIVDKIKTFSFSKKSDLQKLDILIKNNPGLANEAVAAFNKGALDLSDVKSLKELDDTFEEVLKMARKKDVDPKSLRGKWQKAVEKFEKDEKSWKIVKVAAATTAVITAALAVKTFHSKCLAASNNARKDKDEMNKKKAEVCQMLKDEGVIDDNTGKYQTMLAIWRDLNGKHSAARKENLSTLGKLSSSIAEFLDKHSGKDGAESLHKDMKTTLDRANKEKEDEKKEKEDDVYRTRKAQNRADAEDKPDESYAQQKAKNRADAEDKPQDTEDQISRRTYVQQKAKNKADAEDKPKETSDEIRRRSYAARKGTNDADFEDYGNQYDRAYDQKRGHIDAENEFGKKETQKDIENRAYAQRKGQNRADNENKTNNQKNDRNGKK